MCLIPSTEMRNTPKHLIYPRLLRFCLVLYGVSTACNRVFFDVSGVKRFAAAKNVVIPINGHQSL